MKEVAESPVEMLTTLIAEGIRRRGFHFLSPDEVKEFGTEGGWLCRLKNFALDHGWKVICLDKGEVLFQGLKEQLSTTAASRASQSGFQVLHAAKSWDGSGPD